MTEESETGSHRAPKPPSGISVFEPQGADYLALRTPDGTYEMESERARDLARLLFARTEGDSRE